MKEGRVPSNIIGRRRRVSNDTRQVMVSTARKTATGVVEYKNQYDAVAYHEHMNSPRCTEPFKPVSERTSRRYDREDKLTNRTAQTTTDLRERNGADWLNCLSTHIGWEVIKEMFCYVSGVQFGEKHIPEGMQ